MTAANVALRNNATCNGPSAAPTPNSTIVRTIRPISTTTGASASSNDGWRCGRTGTPGAGVEGGSDITLPQLASALWSAGFRRAACLWPGGLDVWHEGVVAVPGGLLVRAAG